jgi:hypothetical protein
MTEDVGEGRILRLEDWKIGFKVRRLEGWKVKRL